MESELESALVGCTLERASRRAAPMTQRRRWLRRGRPGGPFKFTEPLLPLRLVTGAAAEPDMIRRVRARPAGGPTVTVGLGIPSPTLRLGQRGRSGCSGPARAGAAAAQAELDNPTLSPHQIVMIPYALARSSVGPGSR